MVIKEIPTWHKIDLHRNAELMTAPYSLLYHHSPLTRPSPPYIRSSHRQNDNLWQVAKVRRHRNQPNNYGSGRWDEGRSHYIASAAFAPITAHLKYTSYTTSKEAQINQNSPFVASTQAWGCSLIKPRLEYESSPATLSTDGKYLVYSQTATS